ncbi:MAG: LysM peptidoglycan-binding domain-containing protein, partial [Muribaculaceae bacterium]|nr:LysM peptidoglycan-binding domain-containing protein [Muribaculaceae bacterium]
YYVYEAKKNQTFFNIANEFNWDLEELMKINSKVLSPMAKGTKIYYPCETVPGEVVSVESKEILSDIPVQPLTHLVKKGETVYSISMMYGVPVDKIYSLNPNSRKGIKEGEILKVSDKAEKIENTGDNPEFYVIKKGDTLYQLARKYHTTVAAILSINPGISENNFQAGETIKLPTNGEGIKSETKLVEQPKVIGFSSYKVEKQDTWDSIASKTGVSVEDLKMANGGNSHLKSNQMIGIPEVVTDSVYQTVVTEDPRELTLNGVSEIYDDVHQTLSVTDSLAEIKIGILMADATAKKDLEYTRGFLTGLNKVKNGNSVISLKVFDGRLPQDSIIEMVGNYSPSILFTTYDKNTPSFLSDYAMVGQVPVINTFDLKDETYLSNPYFVNLLTPSNYYNEEIASTLSSRYPDATLVIVTGESDSSDILSEVIKEKWNGRKILKINYKDLKGLDTVSGENYLIYGDLKDKSEITSLCDEIEKFRNANINSSIGFVGRANWIIYDESMKEAFSKSDVMIPARFYFDKNSFEAQQFTDAFKGLFDMTPVRTFPMYSTMGYDEAIYFIPSLLKTKGDLNGFTPSYSSVQSDFELVRPSHWSGMMNPTVYLVRFSPTGAIEKQRIK